MSNPSLGAAACLFVAVCAAGPARPRHRDGHRPFRLHAVAAPDDRRRERRRRRRRLARVGQLRGLPAGRAHHCPPAACAATHWRCSALVVIAGPRPRRWAGRASSLFVARGSLLRFVAGRRERVGAGQHQCLVPGVAVALSNDRGGAGVLYAGVGTGIAVAGLHCWRGGAAGVSPDALWLQLGAIALAASARRGRADAARGACKRCAGASRGRAGSARAHRYAGASSSATARSASATSCRRPSCRCSHAR